MTVSEDDAEDYKQQAGEERWQAFLERRAMMGGPEAPEPCETCGGEGEISRPSHGTIPWPERVKCPGRCLGTGVQP